MDTITKSPHCHLIWLPWEFKEYAADYQKIFSETTGQIEPKINIHVKQSPNGSHIR
jgi:hypothetical protein